MLEARQYQFQSNISLLPNLKKDQDRTKWLKGLDRVITENMHKDHVKPRVSDVKAHVMDQLRKAGAPIG